jgi:hypothetical protein
LARPVGILALGALALIAGNILKADAFNRLF